jgi:hypothetical protein
MITCFMSDPPPDRPDPGTVLAADRAQSSLIIQILGRRGANVAAAACGL